MSETITKKEVEIVQNYVQPLIVEAESYTVANALDVDKASVFLRKMAKAEKVIEDKRKSFTGPINQSLKAINATFKELKEPVTAAKKLLTDKILVWRREENARIARAEAEARAKAEAERAKAEAARIEAEEAGKPAPVVVEPAAPPLIPTPMENRIGNIQGRKVWTFRVIDQAKVPEIYKEINRVAINKDIRLGERYIPGLEIYDEEKISIVGRK